MNLKTLKRLVRWVSFYHHLLQFFEGILSTRGSRNDLHLGDITWTRPWTEVIYIRLKMIRVITRKSSFDNSRLLIFFNQVRDWQIEWIQREVNSINDGIIINTGGQSLTKPVTKFGYNVSCENKERGEANLFNFDRRSSMAPARRPSVTAFFSCKLLNIYTQNKVLNTYFLFILLRNNRSTSTPSLI